MGSIHSLYPRICEVDAVGIGAINNEFLIPYFIIPSFNSCQLYLSLGVAPHISNCNNPLCAGEFSKVHDYREPDPYDHAAVRRYKKNHYIGPNEKAAGDPEHTIISFDNEKTEESPRGTQYSLEDTDSLHRFGDKTIEDPGYTASSDDDFYLKPEYEEGYVKPEYDDNTPPRTYGLDDDKKEKSFLSRLRKKFFGNS